MKIDKIKISGFKSIKNPIEIKLPQICALIGPNNVGKSNILSAIYRVLGRDWVTVNTFDESDVYNQDYDQDIVIDITFTEPFIYEQFHSHKVEIPKIRFLYTRYKIGEEKGQRRLEKQCLQLDNKPVFRLKSKPQKGKKYEYEPFTTIPQDIQEKIPVVYIGADRNLRNQLPYARNSLLKILLEDINSDFMKPENTMEIKGIQIPRLERFKQCISAAISALKTDQFNLLEKSIKNNALHQLGFDPAIDTNKLNVFFGPFSSLDFYKSLEIYVKENDFEINATELGGGFQNALVIAIMKAFEERNKQGAIFLIEEPEMFLHPQMQRSLYKTLRKIGETNQVIYITHSPNFVTIPQYDEIIIVGKNEDGTNVTQSSLESTPKFKEKLIKELDPERNELFFAKRILIVEGDTEKLAFPEYAKRTNLDIDKIGSSIIEVGGKRNIPDFVRLALSFKIEVGIVYDKDSSDFENRKEEEKVFNEELDAFKKDGVSVWKFDNNYEDELKKFYGDKEYDKHCQKYPGFHSKPTKARLFASDAEIPIPDFVIPIINWITNNNQIP